MKKKEVVKQVTRDSHKERQATLSTDLSAVEILKCVPVTDTSMKHILASVSEGVLTQEVIREYLAEASVTHVSSPMARLEAFRELLSQFGITKNQDSSTLSITIMPPQANT